jgi:hypothetical protein
VATYVIGDVHGCYTQFTELRERIEARDPEARLILLGDLVHRGREEEKMLEWAFRNVTENGKYQMVLGNHDDAFIEIVGNKNTFQHECKPSKEFETVFSLSDFWMSVDDEYKFKADESKMREYAIFLSKIPLMKRIEVNGRKYVIAHAWHDPQICDTPPKNRRGAYKRRMCLIWDRDIEDNGDIKKVYKPVDGEILVHGHTPTAIFPKSSVHRGFSPGKVWVMGSSVNVDAGLVYNVKQGHEHGNLAAYCLETGQAEYLWNIEDGYAQSPEEYYEDVKEREERERLEAERIREERRKKNMPLIELFCKQVLWPGSVPDKLSNVKFNFLDDFYKISFYPCEKARVRAKDARTTNVEGKGGEQKPIMALSGHYRNETLYLFLDGKWIGNELAEGSDGFNKHIVFKHKDSYYILSVNSYSSQTAFVGVNAFSENEKILIRWETDTPIFRMSDADTILAGNEKLDSSGRYLGLMTCGFYDPHERELFTAKILKYRGDLYCVRIVDSKGEKVVETWRGYYSADNR